MWGDRLWHGAALDQGGVQPGGAAGLFPAHLEEAADFDPEGKKSQTSLGAR
jgi:hypothetical protein